MALPGSRIKRPIWLGKGSSATDNVAEYDLSGIDVIMYAGVADIIGGLRCRSCDVER